MIAAPVAIEPDACTARPTKRLPLPLHFSVSVLIHGALAALMAGIFVIQAWKPAKPKETPIEVTFISPTIPEPVQRKAVPRVRRLEAPAPTEEAPVLVHQDIKPIPAEEAPRQAVNNPNPNSLSVYVGSVIQMIEREKRYPPAALRRGQQGRVVLSLKLGVGGEVLSASVAEPSPFQDLDDASLETIQRIKRFPPLPHDLKQSEIDLKIPVEYKLQ